MARLILWLISLYRRSIPPHKRRRCLFRESCSQHIERIAREHGGFAAMKAFMARARSCRPGYSFEWSTNAATWSLLCADGSKVSETMVSEQIVSEYRLLKARVPALMSQTFNCQSWMAN